jgi:hypothetical protein
VQRLPHGIRPLFLFRISSCIAVVPAALMLATNAAAEKPVAVTPLRSADVVITQGLDFLPQYDIGGVKLGVSAETAERAAQQNGFTYLNRRWLSDYNYEQKLGDALHQRNPKRYPPSKVSEKDTAVIELMQGPLGEKLYIYYAAMPEGRMVRSVRLTFDPKKIDAEKFKQRALAKYGKPSAVSNSLFWCARTVTKSRCGFPFFRDNGYLGLKDYELILSITPQLTKRIDQSIKTRVDAIAPKAELK